MQYFIPKRLKEEPQIFKKPIPIYIKDVAVFGLMVILFFIFSPFIHANLTIGYWIFCFLSCVYLMLPAKNNKNKRNFDMALLFLSKDNATYYSIDRWTDTEWSEKS